MNSKRKGLGIDNTSSLARVPKRQRARTTHAKSPSDTHEKIRGVYKTLFVINRLSSPRDSILILFRLIEKESRCAYRAALSQFQFLRPLWNAKTRTCSLDTKISRATTTTIQSETSRPHNDKRGSFVNRQSR